MLTGHESSVLALLALPSGGFVSGSADSTIRKWEGDGEAGKESQIIKGHSDTVRGLALMPGRDWQNCSPRHPTLFERLICDLIGIICSGEQYLTLRHPTLFE